MCQSFLQRCYPLGRRSSTVVPGPLRQKIQNFSYQERNYLKVVCNKVGQKWCYLTGRGLVLWRWTLFCRLRWSPSCFYLFSVSGTVLPKVLEE